MKELVKQLEVSPTTRQEMEEALNKYEPANIKKMKNYEKLFSSGKNNIAQGQKELLLDEIEGGASYADEVTAYNDEIYGN